MCFDSGQLRKEFLQALLQASARGDNTLGDASASTKQHVYSVVVLSAVTGKHWTCDALAACPQSKLVIRAAAKLAPQPVLSAVAAFLQVALSTAASSNSAAAAAAVQAPQQQAALQRQLQQGHMALEAVVVLLESVLPSLCDAGVQAQQGPQLKEGLAGLLQQVMGLRYRDPLLVTLVSWVGSRQPATISAGVVVASNSVQLYWC